MNALIIGLHILFQLFVNGHVEINPHYAVGWDESIRFEEVAAEDISLYHYGGILLGETFSNSARLNLLVVIPDTGRVQSFLMPFDEDAFVEESTTEIHHRLGTYVLEGEPGNFSLKLEK